MSSEPVRAAADWLALREPADADARATGLVDLVRGVLPPGGGLRVHDLGCGTGAMGRWLAPRLPGPQHWVLHDRDPALLPLARAHPPGRAADGSAVSIETRQDDVTSLAASDLADTSLVTASALLDMMTGREVEDFVAATLAPGCAVLVTLSVTGVVELDPPDPLDERVRSAFNDHQRRPSATGPRLGPDAVAAAVAGFAARGREVVVRPSPWVLGNDRRALRHAWFTGWLGAAVEQDPSLAAGAAAYAGRRPADGGWSAVVAHQDVLVLPG